MAKTSRAGEENHGNLPVLPSKNLIVDTTLPVPFIVVPEAMVNEVVQLGVRAIELGQVTEENLTSADALLQDCHQQLQQIEQIRTKAKAPILKIGTAIDTAIKNLVSELKETKAFLLNGVGTVRAELADRKQKAEAKAAIEEQKRLRELEELRLKNAPPAVIAKAEAKVEQAQVQQEVVQIEHVIPKANIRMVKHEDLVVTDEKLIPDQVAGLMLWVTTRTRQDANIKALLKAGVTVPGCSLKVYEEPQMGGGR